MLAKINRNFVPAYWDDFFNDRVFNSFNNSYGNTTSPAVNIVEDEKEFKIEVAVPGLSRKDFRIEVEDDVLTISSEDKQKKEDMKPNYTRREFSYHSFKRSFQLPETIDQDQIQASHETGVLSIALPKRDEVIQKAPRQIEVK
ncbi:MAG: Hsp20/alpha crystallin family protein [Bacteroidota bacterium]